MTEARHSTHPRGLRGPHVSCALLVLVAMFGFGCDGGTSLGGTCERDAQCATKQCIVHDGVGHCSQPCTTAVDCPDADDGTQTACREDGFCGPLCTFSGMRNGHFCDAETGDAQLCETGDDAEVCTACGCLPFGGGVCAPGTGCIDPLPIGGQCTVDILCQSGLCGPATGRCISPLANGQLCTADRYCVSGLCDGVTDRCVTSLANGAGCEADRYCASGLCDPISDTCVAPLPDGEPCSSDRYCASALCGEGIGCFTPAPLDAPCSRDVQCQSSNCSTDGNWNAVGKCNLPLGSDCAGAAAQCTRCLREAFLGDEYLCSRAFCGPNAACAPNWRCLDTTDGGTGCFQSCNPNSSSTQCWGSRYCRSDGICVTF